MDLTIKLNGDFFENHIPFKYVEYNNVSELKNTFLGDFHQLDITKSKIDSLDKNSEKVRRAAAKYIHEYELIKLICKKVITKQCNSSSKLETRTKMVYTIFKKRKFFRRKLKRQILKKQEEKERI